MNRKKTKKHTRKALVAKRLASGPCSSSHRVTRTTGPCCVATGGFIPSIMGPFVQNVSMLTPLIVASGYRLIRNQKATRKTRKTRAARR